MHQKNDLERLHKSHTVSQNTAMTTLQVLPHESHTLHLVFLYFIITESRQIYTFCQFEIFRIEIIMTQCSFCAYIKRQSISIHPILLHIINIFTSPLYSQLWFPFLLIHNLHIILIYAHLIRKLYSLRISFHIICARLWLRWRLSLLCIITTS